MLSTSVTLLQRVRQREDHAAWQRFVVLYTPLLFRWTQVAGLPVQEAADLIQDVFIILATELPAFDYDPQRGNFRGWLKTITIRKCREQQRRRSLAVGRGGDEDPVATVADDEPDGFWEHEYRELLARRALDLMQDQFPPRVWQACWETVVNGATAAQAGQQLGMSEAAVYVAKFRVLRRLRQELAGLFE